MPAGDVKFTSNAKDIFKQIADSIPEIKDMENPHSRVSIFLDQWVQDNFKGEGSNIPGRWAPFAHGGRLDADGFADIDSKLLQDTGKLRASFVPFATSKNAGIGSDVPYSAKHQKGSRADNLPAREMLPDLDYTAGKRAPSKKVGERIEDIFQNHVVRILSKHDIEVEENA